MQNVSGSSPNVIADPSSSNDRPANAEDVSAIAEFMIASVGFAEQSNEQTRGLGTLIAVSTTSEITARTMRDAATELEASTRANIQREVESVPVGIRAYQLSRGDINANNTIDITEPGGALPIGPTVTPAPAAREARAEIGTSDKVGIDRLMATNLVASELVGRLGYRGDND